MNYLEQKIIFLILSVCLSTTVGVMAQGNGVTESNNRQAPVAKDNFYDQYITSERQTLNYDYIHEKDVFWEKRVWSLIDIREKQNHAFANENAPLITTLVNAVRCGDLQAYSPLDDRFSTVIPKKDAKTIGITIDTITTFDSETFHDVVPQIVRNEFDPSDVKQYRLKEVYYVDEETGKMGVRILGIAPIIDRYNTYGDFLNSGPMFWVYYPEARQLLAKKAAFNAHNDAHNLSWEDIFEGRMFSSYIVKKSNIHDRRIKDYATSPMGALLEADRIKGSIFNFEQDLWTY